MLSGTVSVCARESDCNALGEHPVGRLSLAVRGSIKFGIELVFKGGVEFKQVEMTGRQSF